LKINGNCFIDPHEYKLEKLGYALLCIADRRKQNKGSMRAERLILRQSGYEKDFHIVVAFVTGRFRSFVNRLQQTVAGHAPARERCCVKVGVCVLVGFGEKRNEGNSTHHNSTSVKRAMLRRRTK
jgi:hypothetical protein